MPPYKQPTLLRDLALRRTADLIEDKCVQISERLCAREERYDDAARMSEFLVANIRPFLDELCWYTFTKPRVEPLWLAGEVLLSTYMNHHTKHLTFRGDSTVCNYYLLDEHFWQVHLCRVPNLVELHLEAIESISSELFRILGQCCPHLEVIKFHFQATNSFEDLKTIKSLRIIKNTGKEWYFDTQRNLLCTLLRDLPRLEYINSCSCMGEVLESFDNVSSLGLTEVWDTMPTMNGVHTIVRLCKNLKALTIGCHKASLSEDFHNVVTPITQSLLEISKLKLFSFGFSTPIEDLFHKKGIYIKSLTLGNMYDSSTVKTLITIGTYCRHLEYFNIYNLIIDPNIYQHTPYQASEPIFQKLVKFVCNAINPVPVQVCLIHAQHVQCVSVSAEYWNIDEEETGDLLTAELISKNPMKELQSLCIDFYASEFILSQYLIQHLFYSLPKLVKLDLLNMVHSPELEECLQTISKHIELNNMDLSFRYSFDGRP